MNRDELIHRFTYHPPNTPEKVKAHDAVNKVFTKLMDVTMSMGQILGLEFQEANELFLEAVLELNDLVPDSADKSAAVRDLQLARNFVNLGIREKSFFYVRRANEHLLRAKFQCNAAVAIAMAKPELAPDPASEPKPAPKPVTRASSKKKA